MKPIIHLIVKVSNYAKFDYTPFIDKNDKPIPRPNELTYQIGQVVYIKEENALGVVLGCIDESSQELRTDMSGMVCYSQIEPAIKEFFSIPNVHYSPQLYNEVFGTATSRATQVIHRDK